MTELPGVTTMNTIKLADIDYMPDESHSAFVLCWADGPHGAGFEWFSTEAELATAKPPEGEQTYTFFITVPFNDSLTEAINGCFHDHIMAHQWEQRNPDKVEPQVNKVDASLTTFKNLRIRPDGEANFYGLIDGDKWVAVVHLNGEFMTARQEAIMQRIIAALKAD